MEATQQTNEEAQRAKQRQYRKTYRATHPEQVKAEKRRWRERTRGKRALRDVEDPAAKAERLQKNREYNAAHKDHRSEYNKAYYLRKKAAKNAAPPPAGGDQPT